MFLQVVFLHSRLAIFTPAGLTPTVLYNVGASIMQDNNSTQLEAFLMLPAEKTTDVRLMSQEAFNAGGTTPFNKESLL